MPWRGFNYTLGQWAGREALASLDPILRSETAKPGASVLAKEGYTVGGLVVDADGFVVAVQVIFVRLKPDGKPNPADRYTSDWIGKSSGKPPQTLDAQGATIIGLHGGRAAVLDSVGLILE